MTRRTPFGRHMRDAHFQFSPTYTPLNHGSYGAYPAIVQSEQDKFTKSVSERPDSFIVYKLPGLIDESRKAIAPFLGIDVDEVVFIPNATTGVNVVLRNLKFVKGDVVIYFNTIYKACRKTLSSIEELVPVRGESIELQYPVSDADIVEKFRDRVAKVRDGGEIVRVAIFDTVLSFPGARMPWEGLVKECKELGVMSLIDGAHGVGHIDLTLLGEVSPDFFVSNCYKWLFSPRPCAVFHVPTRNQHLIRTSIPTSHGYQYPHHPEPSNKPPFVHLFEFVATMDYTPYCCVPAAIEFRNKVCGGEAAIRDYCFQLARKGGEYIADYLGTEVLGKREDNFTQCYFSTVKLPFTFTVPDESLDHSDHKMETAIDLADAGILQAWLNVTSVKEFDTFLQVDFYNRFLWCRFSGQIYLEFKDFEWAAPVLKGLCERAAKGEYRV